MSPEGTETVDRGSRRRAETNARLVAAAKELFARQGIDATRIQQITEEADVGFGSFYNHFEDKDAIVEAVLADVANTQADEIELISAGVEDPAEIVAIAHRHFIQLAAKDTTWGWLVVRLDVSHRILAATLGPRALRDLKAGADVGRFEVGDEAVTLNATGGALLGSMRALLEGNAGPGVDERHAGLILRMLGLSPEEADEVASRPLPELPS